MDNHRMQAPMQAPALAQAQTPAQVPFRTVRLAHATDLAGFRTAARALVQAGVAPLAVHWVVASTAAVGASPTAGAMADRFDTPAEGALEEGRPGGLDGLVARRGAPAVPRSFVDECERLVLHADPARFALMYRLLWRHAHEPGLRHDALDPDRQRARRMVHAVARDLHKMRAFVRFRQVQDEAGTLHVAWFEPDHHIVQTNAGFFARRFAGMRWAILTPQLSLRWDGSVLDIGPGAQRSDAPPPDAGEALWLTYYRHIFNPARLKLSMMRKEMPRRYWPNLPEAQLIGELAQSALQRSAAMVAAEPSTPRRRIVPLVLAQDPARAGDLDPDAVRSAPDLAHLYAQTRSCRACPIGAHATQAVPGEGALNPQRMLVGEQPGDHEDLQGRAFVGPAGQLLDQALQQLGWPRGALYLTNAVKHFKYVPRGRWRIHQRPAVGEVQACSLFLEREIALVAPQTLLALGATAARALLGHAVVMEDVRGQWHTGVQGLPVLVAWHPSALLRAPDGQRAGLFQRWLRDLAAPLPQGFAAGH